MTHIRLARRFPVTVTCATLPQAQRVLAARLDHDRDYDFAYTLDWDPDAVEQTAHLGEPAAFTFTVSVHGCPLADARQVLVDRLGYDEDHGFGYTLDWTLTPLLAAAA